jgi:broad specificity phosphatase PhoE
MADPVARPPTTVFLLRHTDVDGGDCVLWGRSPGVQLSRVGRAAARSLARSLTGQGIRQVVSSPQPCALETAAVVASATRAVLRVEPGLDEFDFGDWTGRGFTELARDTRWTAFGRTHTSGRAPNGESIPAFQDRVHRAIDALVDDLGAIAVVTHEAVIRAALLRWMLWRPTEWSAIDVPPGSVAELRRVGDEWMVRLPQRWSSRHPPEREPSWITDSPDSRNRSTDAMAGRSTGPGSRAGQPCERINHAFRP